MAGLASDKPYTTHANMPGTSHRWHTTEDLGGAAQVRERYPISVAHCLRPVRICGQYIRKTSIWPSANTQIPHLMDTV